jgi:phosphopantothenoylcysteine decarboxylase / phosphopantothenate---cysteine ligase
MNLRGKRVLVGIGGGIAAYKVCEILSSLAKSEVEVRAILTRAAAEFITPLTVSTLCRHPAYTDETLWSGESGRPLHIELAEWAEVFLMAPLTANTLAKLVFGMADNLLTNTVLASTCPLLVAPAMNTTMWEQATVQHNWQQLRQYPRIHSVGPAAGRLACDAVGAGRMAEPSDILDYLSSLMHTGGQRDLQGKRILISSGGTREYLDAVRFIGNPATGKMGLALAQAAWHRGAMVHLIQAGDLLPPVHDTLTTTQVTTAAQMQSALQAAFPQTDWTLMAAAVADVRPQQTILGKMAKQELPSALPLAPVPDLVQELGQMKQAHQRIIGFAAQTGDILTPAKEKLQRKGLDAIVANPIDQAGSGFGSDSNQAIFIDRHGQQTPIPLCSKLLMAHKILDLVNRLDAAK